MIWLPPAGAVDIPDVTLVYPQDGYISSSAYVNLSCNATDDENVYSTSLYIGSGGSLSLYETNFTMGLQNDSYTLLLCGFDNSSYTCLDGENGTGSETSFEDSMMGTGVLVDDTDTVSYPSSGNIDGDHGTIEMWLRVDFVPSDTDEYDLFSTGSGPNDIRLWKDSSNGVYGEETLKLEYYSYDSLAQTAEANISSWSVGEWHHIAAIWDADMLMGGGDGVDLFLDGSNLTTISDSSFYATGGFGDIRLGSSDHYGWTTSSLFDEISISSVVRSQYEINASYNRLIADHGEETYNWTVANAGDGTYTWNCMAVDSESQGAWGAESRTFTVDAVTPPAIVSANLTPDDAATLDPGVSIAVVANLTDVSNVSSVKLMYKSPYAGIYTNDTMDYNSATGLWENGTIVTNLDEGNWSYRFWSNDSWNHRGMSAVYTVDVSKDRTWTLEVRNASGSVIESLDEVRGFAGSVQTAGIICVNNTGDYVSSFDFSADFTEEVSYNDTESFDLSQSASKCLEVTATMPETPNEYELVIDIATTSLPAERSVNASVISYIGGPYINDSVDIISYPMTIAQGGSGNFTAKVKNIGNETAYNVTLNWTLPDGWSLSYGNASELLGDIEPYRYVSRTVTADASSSAAAGAAMVLINASSINGTAGGDFKVLSVSCTSGDGTCGSGCSPSTDTDCETEPVAGGRTRIVGVGTISVTEPAISVSFPERLDIQKGERLHIYVNVSNPLRGNNVSSVSLGIDGYDDRYITVTPPGIAYIAPLAEKSFALEVWAPPYIEEKEYVLSVSVTAKGNAGGIRKDLESSSRIVISVHGVMGNESLAAISDAQEALAEMEKAGLNVARLESMLSDARMSYDALDFDGARDKALQIVRMRDVAIGLLSSFSALEGKIEEAEGYGVKVGESRKMMDLAKSAFQRGDYDRAQSRITAAVNAYQLETKDVLGVLRAVREYWQYAALFVACLATASFLARKRVQKAIIEKRLALVRERRGALKGLVRELQEKYYGREDASKAEYLGMMGLYARRDAALLSEELKLRRAIASKSRGKGWLDRHRQETGDEMKKLQRDFFERGAIGKAEYELGMSMLQEEMAEIEKERSGKSPGKAKGTFCLALAVLLLAASLPGISSAQDASQGVAETAIREAAAAVDGMSAKGFRIERANGTLETARSLFKGGDYALSATTARYVTVIRDKAFSVDSMLDATEMRLREFSAAGRDVSSLEADFGSALSQFDSESYEDALDTLVAIDDALDDMEKEYALQAAAGAGTLSAVWESVYAARVMIGVAAAAAALASVPAARKVGRMRRKRKVRELNERVAQARESMKALQREYFHDGTVSKKAYVSRMEKLRGDLAAALEGLAAERASGH